MYKKSWDKRGVSPIIAEILMVAIAVVMASMLYFTAEEITNKKSQVTPRGALYSTSSANHWNYTVTVFQLSAPVNYKEAYFTIQPPNGTQLLLGSPTGGLTENLASGNFTYYTTPDSGKIMASDTLRVNGGHAWEYEGTIIMLIDIETGGIIATTILD